MTSASDLKQIVEAALLAAGEPLSLDALQALFLKEEQPEKRALREVIEALQDDYRGRGMELLELVGLAERWFHKPIEMSGGQQQRTAIARSMANHPQVLLCDEPTGNLDLRTGAEIHAVLQQLNRERGVTIICVTHDHRLIDMADRIMWVRDGQIERMRRVKSPDCIHVKDAMNRILDLNTETLNLPVEVLNMEFAEGMLSSLDKFTSMIWPYQEEEFRKRTMGSFCGIGVQIRKDPGRAIEVVTPLADAPAVRAGMRAGDYIVRVGGA